MSEAKQVPLLESLRSVPMNCKVVIEEHLSSRSIPCGRYCHEAAERIALLERVAEAAAEAIVKDDPENGMLSTTYIELDEALRAAGYLGGGNGMSKATYNGNQYANAVPNDAHMSGNGGLTKREYFAAMAMQGLTTIEYRKWENLATDAVNVADALLAALEEGK